MNDNFDLSNQVPSLERQEVLNQGKSLIVTETGVDKNHTELEELQYLIRKMLDTSNYVDYTFSGTGANKFNHQLGRIPRGYIIISQSLYGNIKADLNTFNSQTVTMTSETASNQVRFIFL